MDKGFETLNDDHFETADGGGRAAGGFAGDIASIHGVDLNSQEGRGADPEYSKNILEGIKRGAALAAIPLVAAAPGVKGAVRADGHDCAAGEPTAIHQVYEAPTRTEGQQWQINTEADRPELHIVAPSEETDESKPSAAQGVKDLAGAVHDAAGAVTDAVKNAEEERERVRQAVSGGSPSNDDPKEGK